MEPLDTDLHGPLALDSTEWDEAGAVRAAAQRELHPDLVRTGAARFPGIALASAAAFAAYLVAHQLGVPSPSLPGREGPIAPQSLLLAGLGLSASAYGATWIRRLSPALVLGMAYIHLLAISLILGLFRHLEPRAAGEFLYQIAPVVLPLLAFGALIPALPRTAGLTLFGAAALDPLALFLLRQGGPPLSASQWALAIASPLLGALVGYHMSLVVHRLSERAARARDIGSYRLVERLGVGGMAEVWRADHRLLARPAAVKLVRRQVLIDRGPHDSERLLRLFMREARTTASLNSPHTIQIYDFGVTREGAFYYVMELLDGVSLQELVERFGPQPPERVARTIAEVCHSLEEAHARDFVHRDIKPGNIYVCHYGEDYDFVKVLDFGLVLDRHPTAEELEDERRQVGTPAVMAPEMVRFQAPVDARADLYALGCVAYWLLTGTRVFEANSRQDMLVMHAHQKPLPPSRRVGRELHPGLEALVMTCLEKNPAKRPQTARDLAERLGELAFESSWSDERARLWWRRERPTEAGDLPSAPAQA